MKKSFPFHPILFAIFPIIFLYSHNIGEVFFSDIILPLSMIIISAVIIFFVMDFFIKDYQKTSVLFSVFLVWFFSYGHLYDALKGNMFFRHRFLFPFWCLLLFISAILIVKSKKKYFEVNNFLNISASVIILLLIFNIAVFQFRTGSTQEGSSLEASNPLKSEIFSFALPDIYYIILDAYASEDVLEKFYGFDNSEFLDFLQDKGFYVVPDARSNYGMTPLSLASSLNMRYVNHRGKKAARKDDYKPAYKMIRNNEVIKFLKEKGYLIIHFASLWSSTSLNPQADVNINPFKLLNDFALSLAKQTILNPVCDYYFTRISRALTLNAFGKLSQVPYFEGPTFAFAHLVVPHHPFIFTASGEEVEIKVAMSQQPEIAKQAYIEQLIFTNKKVKELINAILKRSKEPPIIILQSDHGPGMFGLDKSSHAYMKNRLKILNAYYLPYQGIKRLYNDITPVNTFRLIFDHYFLEDLGFLKDISYFSDYKNPYKLINIEHLFEKKE